MEHAAFTVEPYGLGVAHGLGPVLHVADVVSPAAQLGGDAVGDAGLELERLGLFAPGTAIEPAGSLDGFLHVKTIVDDAGEHRGLALGLSLAPHGAKQERRLAVTQGHGRDDGVERPLAWLQSIGMLRVELEKRAPVLEEDARPLGHKAGTELEVDALDERHGEPVLVGGAHVDGVAAHAGVDAGGRLRALHVDLLPTLPCVLLG